MSDCLSEETIKVISKYLPVLEKMPSSKRNDFIKGIIEMRKYGIEGFSKRVIYKNGYSSMFCTSLNWHKMKKEPSFLEDFRNHLSPELVQIKKNRSSFVSRSKDKIYTPFLKKLENAGVNNSIITTDFYEDRIEIVYLIANPSFPQDRDLILNNMPSISLLQNIMKPALRDITLSQEFQDNKELLLNETAINCLWGIKYQDTIIPNLFISGKEINITYKELECLVYLRFGSSKRFIADRLNISVETVKHHVFNLKLKLSVLERDELIEIAQLKSLINISKTLGLV